MVLKSPPACFKTTNTSVQWQLGNYFEHCMDSHGQTSLCIVSSLPLIDILYPLHTKSICTYQDLISPTQSKLNPAALISPTAITPLTDPSDRSQRSLPHNRSPCHGLLNPTPLKILSTHPKVSSTHSAYTASPTLINHINPLLRIIIPSQQASSTPCSIRCWVLEC